MSTHVVIQPSGSKGARLHYRDTIENPVAITRIIKFLSSEQYSALPDSIKNRTSIPVWGVKPGTNEVNVKKWDRLQAGDIALFSGDKIIFASGVVVHKIRSKELGIELWKPKDSDDPPYEYLYFLDEISPREISYEDFNAVAGYETNNNLMGFLVLDEEKSEQILFGFDLYSDQYFPPINAEEFENTVKAFDPNKPLDAKTEGYARTEQSFLRNVLFGKKSEAICCMCGKDYPVGFLVAAHIKKRAKCTTEERLDAENIVAPMCKFGCDELYEKGYIGVADDGLVIQLKQSPQNCTVKNYINNILGQSCLGWNTNSSKYFDWHRKQNI